MSHSKDFLHNNPKNRMIKLMVHDELIKNTLRFRKAEI